MIIVSDTTPLIGLASIERFGILKKLFCRIYIPQAVYGEAVVAGHKNGGAREEVSSAGWIETVSVRDRLAVEVLLDELDKGEAETIVLAEEVDADWVLMDEKKGRRKLKKLRLRKIGTLGILLKAKDAGLLDTIGPAIKKLRNNGFSISQPVIDTVLKEAGE